jgi:hypothetical protein
MPGVEILLSLDPVLSEGTGKVFRKTQETGISGFD